jgi:hypothetical protein
MPAFVIGKNQYYIGQLKSDNNIKVLLIKNNDKWEEIMRGSFDDVQKYIKKEKTKQDKKEYRQMVAEMNGTSYRVACRDMGINPK